MALPVPGLGSGDVYWGDLDSFTVYSADTQTLCWLTVSTSRCGENWLKKCTQGTQ